MVGSGGRLILYIPREKLRMVLHWGLGGSEKEVNADGGVGVGVYVG